jgi:hypothetical protein
VGQGREATVRIATARLSLCSNERAEVIGRIDIPPVIGEQPHAVPSDRLYASAGKGRSHVLGLVGPHRRQPETVPGDQLLAGSWFGVTRRRGPFPG